MSGAKDGGPAFPCSIQELTKEPHEFGNTRSRTVDHPGMSLRDWFAGQALQGAMQVIYSDEGADALRAVREVTGISADGILADQAYVLADAMLARREKGDEP